MNMEALEMLRKLEAEEDAKIARNCNDTVRRYLESHAFGKPPKEMDKYEFAEFLAFTTAESTLLKLARKYNKRAAEAAAQEILREETDVEEPTEELKMSDFKPVEKEPKKPEDKKTAEEDLKRLSLANRLRKLSEKDPEEEKNK